MTEQQITLVLVKNDEMIDITGLVEQIEWSGRKGAAPRTLNVSMEWRVNVLWYDTKTRRF